jgi:hypothetical protein
MSDPPRAGNGYRHGKTRTRRCGSTPRAQAVGSGHAFTRFLNGRCTAPPGFESYQARVRREIALVRLRREG